MAELGRDVDDGPATGTADFRNREFARQEGARQIDCERPVPVIESEGFHGTVGDDGGGNINQHGEMAESINGGPHARFHACCAGNVHLDRDRLAP